MPTLSNKFRFFLFVLDSGVRHTTKAAPKGQQILPRKAPNRAPKGQPHSAPKGQPRSCPEGLPRKAYRTCPEKLPEVCPERPTDYAQRGGRPPTPSPFAKGCPERHYRNAGANSMCLSKRGCGFNLLIETRVRTQFAYRNAGAKSMWPGRAFQNVGGGAKGPTLTARSARGPTSTARSARGPFMHSFIH